MKLDTVGVVGAGVMGVGVAQNLAQSGFQVRLIDVSDEILNKARVQIRQNTRFQGFFAKGEGPRGDSESVLKRITYSTDYGALADADFVVENVTENWEIKKRVYQTIDPLTPAHAVYAVNTSAISITRVGTS